MGTSENPTFISYEEMQKFLDERTELTTAKKKSVDKKKRRQYTDPTPKKEKDIYRTTHYYTRKGDTFTQVLKDCREELERSGDSTIVMAHCHQFNMACVDSCRAL